MNDEIRLIRVHDCDDKNKAVFETIWNPIYQNYDERNPDIDVILANGLSSKPPFQVQIAVVLY